MCPCAHASCVYVCVTGLLMARLGIHVPPVPHVATHIQHQDYATGQYVCVCVCVSQRLCVSG